MSTKDQLLDAWALIAPQAILKALQPAVLSEDPRGVYRALSVLTDALDSTLVLTVTVSFQASKDGAEDLYGELSPCELTPSEFCVQHARQEAVDRFLTRSIERPVPEVQEAVIDALRSAGLPQDVAVEVEVFVESVSLMPTRAFIEYTLRRWRESGRREMLSELVENEDAFPEYRHTARLHLQRLEMADSQPFQEV